MNRGTAAVVRSRGFTAPAAGKTGSSHDAWFAGFTSNLLCLVWVGYDDYSDIKLTGGVLAGPIWAEFMKRAIQLPNYSDVKGFYPPSGVVQLTLDKATNRIATPACPDDYLAAFIEGTQPTQTCDQLPSTEQRTLIQKIFGLEPKPAPPSTVSNSTNVPSPGQAPNSSGREPNGKPAEKPGKRGFFRRIFGGKDGNTDRPPG